MASDELRERAERLKESALAYLRESEGDDDGRDDSELVEHWRDQLQCASAVIALLPLVRELHDAAAECADGGLCYGRLLVYQIRLRKAAAAVRKYLPG